MIGRERTAIIEVESNEIASKIAQQAEEGVYAFKTVYLREKVAMDEHEGVTGIPPFLCKGNLIWN